MNGELASSLQQHYCFTDAYVESLETVVRIAEQVNTFVRILPNDFTAEQLLAMCDLTTPAGRRAAAKAVCQQARYNVIARGVHR